MGQVINQKLKKRFMDLSGLFSFVKSVKFKLFHQNEGTKIKKNCQITGPVIIGKNCILEENTIIGPNTSIGDNSKISKSDIQDSIIMNDCEIKTSVKIRNSIISANSKIESAGNEEKVFLLGEGTNIKI